MSAVEALAEVLIPHSFMARYTVNTDGSWTWKCSCGHEYRYGVEIADQEIQHRAQAIVAAIRSMPAEQVAELIDGERLAKAIEGLRPKMPAYPSRLQDRIIGEHVGIASAAALVREQFAQPVSPETNGEQR